MATLLSHLSFAATVDTARLLATARGTPLFATSAQDARTLDSLVAEATAAPAYSPPAWPRDAEMLCGNWRLITTTNGRTGGPVLPLMDAQPDATLVVQHLAPAMVFPDDDKQVSKLKETVAACLADGGKL